MNIAKLVGIVFGVTVGLVICFIAFRFLNKDGSIKTKYDERQDIARGKSYRFGFWGLCAALFALILLDSAEIVIPAEPIVIYFSIFFVGAVALCVHSIFNGSYFGINNMQSKWISFFIFFGVINGLISVMAYVNGSLIVDGQLTVSFVNVLCCLMLVIAIIAIGIKKLIDNREDNANEES